MKNKILMICFIITIFGCYDDKSTLGNFNLVEIEILKESNYTSYVNEVSEIFIPIHWNGEDSTNYEFFWITPDNDTISKDRKLVYTFNKNGILPLLFGMINKLNGITYSEPIDHNVSSKFLLGWLLLSEKEGKSSLDYIHVDTYELFQDIYHQINPENSLGTDPIRLDANMSTTHDQINVLQREGSCVLDGRDFNKVLNVSEEFIGEKYPYEGFVPVRAFYPTQGGGNLELLLSEKGELYNRRNTGNRGNDNYFNFAWYSTSPFEFTDKASEIKFMLTPIAVSYTLMYDAFNRRYIPITLSGNGSILAPPYFDNTFEEGDPEDKYDHVFDISEGMDENLELLYGGMCKELSQNTLVNIIRDNNSSKYYYQQMAFTSTRFINPEQFEFAEGYGLNIDSKFLLLSGAFTLYDDEPHLIFTVDKKVYFYKRNNDKIFLLVDFDNLPDSPTGKITSLGDKKHTANYELGVAFDDGNFYIVDVSETIINGIAQSEIDPEKTIDRIVKHSYSGLGNIVHCIFKYGNISNWVLSTDTYR